MHVEIKVAHNFVLNFLYNKLPRRRVNLFGEELESALRDKFQDHWYPDKPFKGSAFRCLKITDPADPVLNRAARESGNPVTDIIENLPADLAIWIDPGEVSYRIGEKGSVKILFSENDGAFGHVPSSSSTGSSLASEPDLSPAAENFPMMDNLNSALSSLTIQPPSQPAPPAVLSPPTNAPPPPPPGGFTPFQPRPQPLTYTAGTFAQTKFGSTKLKSNGKKTNRMSPTEFSNYIKQRAMQKGGSGFRPPPTQNNGFNPRYYNQNNMNTTPPYYGRDPAPSGYPYDKGNMAFDKGGMAFDKGYSGSSSNNHGWPYDTEAFLQDIFSQPSPRSPRSDESDLLGSAGSGALGTAGLFSDRFGFKWGSELDKSPSLSPRGPPAGQPSDRGGRQQQRVLVAN